MLVVLVFVVFSVYYYFTVFVLKVFTKHLGPYIHRNYDKAVDPVWNEDRSNVTYIQRIASFPNFTVGVDANMYTDKITLLNPYYLGAIKNIGSEQALLVKMTAPALLTIITNLQVCKRAR